MSYLINVLKYNFVIAFRLSTIIALGLCILSFEFFNYGRMTSSELAIFGEYYLPAIGIMFFIHIPRIEERSFCSEITNVKKTSPIFIFSIRLLLALICVLVVIFTMIFCFAHNKFTFEMIIKSTFGSYITALFLGFLGMTISSLTKNLSSGYIISFGYLFFEILTKGAITKKFYLLSMTNNSYAEKNYVLCLAIILLILNIALVLSQNKHFHKIRMLY